MPKRLYSVFYDELQRWHEWSFPEVQDVNVSE